MMIANTIENKLNSAIDLIHLDVINESSGHNVPPGSESHFKVVLVSTRFVGMSLISRHRLINDILADELSDSIHALAIHAYSPDEWESNLNDVPQSPLCHGGGKAV